MGVGVNTTVISNGVFMLGDCFERMRELPDASVDMVLADLPYGTTQNKWDSVLPLEPLWAEYWRVCKPNAAVVLTAQTPFDKALGMSQIECLKYEWIWYKNKPSGFLNARKFPLKAHENVLVFCRGGHLYNPQGLTPVSVNQYRRNKAGNGNYGKVAQKDYTQTEGGFPYSVLQIPVINNDKKDRLHPTQKPVALFEYLIRTYTNEGDTVLDNTAGSGTTAVAAERCGRRWVCIERDETYYTKAVERVIAASVGDLL